MMIYVIRWEYGENYCLQYLWRKIVSLRIRQLQQKLLDKKSRGHCVFATVGCVGMLFGERTQEKTGSSASRKSRNVDPRRVGTSHCVWNTNSRK